MDCDKKFLSIYRGDDTAFNNGSGFAFVIDTLTDSMEGFSVEFSFLGITKTITTFTRVSEKKFSFNIQFTREETKGLPLCFQNAKIVMKQAVGSGDSVQYLYRTLTNECLIHITNDTHEVYEQVGVPFDIHVQPGTIAGSLIGIVLDLNASLEDRMNALAQIVLRGSGTVVPKATTPDDEDDGQ